jgi:hypothetical protein
MKFLYYALFNKLHPTKVYNRTLLKTSLLFGENNTLTFRLFH